MDERPRVFCAGLPLIDERALSDVEWSEVQSRRRADERVVRRLPLHATLLMAVSIAVCILAQRFQGDPTWLAAIAGVPLGIVLRDSFFQQRLKQYPSDRDEARIRRFAGTVGPEYRNLLRMLRRGRRSRQRSLSAEVETLLPGGALWTVDGFTASSLWAKSFWSEVESVAGDRPSQKEAEDLRSRCRKGRIAWLIGTVGEVLYVSINLLFLTLFSWLLILSAKIPVNDDLRKWQADLLWQIGGAIAALPILIGMFEFARRRRRVWVDLSRELRDPRLVTVEGTAGRDGREVRLVIFEHSRILWTIDGVPAPWRFGLSWRPARGTVLRKVNTFECQTPADFVETAASDSGVEAHIQ